MMPLFILLYPISPLYAALVVHRLGIRVTEPLCAVPFSSKKYYKKKEEIKTPM